jgi:acetyl esterase/lipase
MTDVTRRAFGRLAGGAAVAAAAHEALAAGAAGASAPAFDPTPYVNPELRPLLGPILRVTANRRLSLETLDVERKGGFARPIKVSPAWAERTIPGAKGSPDLKVYVINPGAPAAPAKPAILHIHGGGFVLGRARQNIGANQDLASLLDCVVVSVDYRLAPETRFPGPLEDNYTALTWLYRNAAELGVDRTRIAVMGESAGGGHAAMLAIAARDRGEVPLVYQALVYPMLDDRTGSTRRKPPYMGMVVWNEQRNRFGWTSLLGVPAGAPRVPYGAVPARVENLKGLPPAFIGVGSIDLFADEDIEYARRLVDAGVPVRLNLVPGAFHGFDNFEVPIAKAFREDLVASLRSALRPGA